MAHFYTRRKIEGATLARDGEVETVPGFTAKQVLNMVDYVEATHCVRQHSDMAAQCDDVNDDEGSDHHSQCERMFANKQKNAAVALKRAKIRITYERRKKSSTSQVRHDPIAEMWTFTKGKHAFSFNTLDLEDIGSVI